MLLEVEGTMLKILVGARLDLLSDLKDVEELILYQLKYQVARVQMRLLGLHLHDVRNRRDRRHVTALVRRELLAFPVLLEYAKPHLDKVVLHYR